MLVTGATGYLGRRVAAEIAARLATDGRWAGAELHLTSRRPPIRPPSPEPRASALLSPEPSSSKPSTLEPVWHPADLLEPGAAERLIATVRPRLLLHLAWDVTPGAYWTSPDNMRWRDATAALARAFFAAGGARFVGAGTCAEYDWTTGVCDEATTPIAPASIYGQAKADAWRAVAEAADAGRGQAAWGRFFYLYGGADEHPSRLVPSIVDAIQRGEPALCSPGDQRRDFLHVDDAAAAFVALAASDVAGPVNIASGVARPVRDVIEQIARSLGRPDLVRLGARPADPVPLVVARVERLQALM